MVSVTKALNALGLGVSTGNTSGPALGNPLGLAQQQSALGNPLGLAQQLAQQNALGQLAGQAAGGLGQGMYSNTAATSWPPSMPPAQPVVVRSTAHFENAAFDCSLETAKDLWLAKHGNKFVNAQELAQEAVDEGPNALFFHLLGTRLYMAGRMESFMVSGTLHTRIPPE